MSFSFRGVNMSVPFQRETPVEQDGSNSSSFFDARDRGDHGIEDLLLAEEEDAKNASAIFWAEAMASMNFTNVSTTIGPSSSSSPRDALSSQCFSVRDRLTSSSGHSRGPFASGGGGDSSESHYSDCQSALMETIRVATLNLLHGQWSDATGLVTRDQLRDEMQKECKTLNNHQFLDAAVDALMQDAVPSDQDPPQGLTFDQFSVMFENNPDLYRIFKDKLDDNCNTNAKPTRPEEATTVIRTLTPAEQAAQEQENEQTWKTHWKNHKVKNIWLALYVLATIAAFGTKAYKYAVHRDDATEIMGGCIVVARGAAQCLNLNCALILIPMLRHVMTRLRQTKLRHYVPFDDLERIHILIGVAIAFWTTMHVGAHICDFSRLSNADEDDIMALVGDNPEMAGFAQKDPSGRWIMALFQTRAGVTGILMVLCCLVAYPMTQVRKPKIVRGTQVRKPRFNVFWNTHHLLILMLLLLCIHGTANLLEHYQSVFWVGLPFLLYIGSRIWRETPLSNVHVLDAQLKSGGDVLMLRLQKPVSWNERLRAGMYAFVKVPAISSYEWHPFTLTSKPSDPFLEFHQKSSGDWTSKLQAHVREIHLQAAINNNESTETSSSLTNLEDSRPRDHEEKVEEGFELENGDVVAIRTNGQPPANDTSDQPTLVPVMPAIPTGITDMVVKVEGPMGASAQGFKEYPVVVLIGGGIGVTPMICVLKELLVNPGKMRRVFFYWSTRDPSNLEMFTALMDEIYLHDDPRHVLQTRHFLTSIKNDDRSLDKVLLHHATRAPNHRCDFDLILGQQTHHQVEVGRPKWDQELKSVQQEAMSLGCGKCGVFVCGNHGLASAVDESATKLSGKDFHFYFSKETF
ncbi:oxidase homolog protein [Seminavis robusta]|uniref:Oxidase homolog protein n=1 Tax=Seminavis robusta TaxID=568900 RepID=A0A9N8E5G2_9STRA|nr:oxidase homolog protein [Seminavis robusta]|eukprot:Sro680_g186270.1 oxidase homolog protein (858) ;mRNA; r:36758-39464